MTANPTVAALRTARRKMRPPELAAGEQAQEELLEARFFAAGRDAGPEGILARELPRHIPGLAAPKMSGPLHAVIQEARVAHHLWAGSIPHTTRALPAVPKRHPTWPPR